MTGLLEAASLHELSRTETERDRGGTEESYRVFCFCLLAEASSLSVTVDVIAVYRQKGGERADFLLRVHFKQLLIRSDKHQQDEWEEVYYIYYMLYY